MAMSISRGGMMLEELNEKAWRVSAFAMMRDNEGKWKVCTSGKIREIYEKVGGAGADFVKMIKDIMNEYSQPEEKKENERVFKAFGAKLVKELEGMKREEAKQLMEYVLWDIRELERLFRIRDDKKLKNKLGLRLKAEGVRNLKIADEIVGYWKTGGREGMKKGEYPYKR
jgi:hypothetical protein